jgi:hypothetical protein
VCKKSNEEYFSKFDDSCLHGAPDINGEYRPIASQVVIFAQQIIACHESAIARLLPFSEVSMLEEFCLSNSQVASNPLASKIFVSMGIDSYVEKNYQASKLFLRCVFFFETFSNYGTIFIENLKSNEVGAQNMHESMLAFTTAMNRTTTNKGILDALRARIPCKCLECL